MTRHTRSLALLALAGATGMAATAGAQRVVDTPIRVGQKVSDALRGTDPVAGNGRPYRIYRFDADSGKRYSVTLHSSAFDAYVRVLRPAGPISEEVGSDDDSGPGNDAMLRVRAMARGPHYISVESFDDSLGAFDLELAELPDRPLVTRPIAMSQTVRGSLGENSARNERDWPLDVHVLRADGARSVRAVLTASALESYIAIGRMTNGRFVMLEESSDGGATVREPWGVATRRREGSGQTRPRATFTARLPARGEYAVRVLGASGSASGSYALRLEDGSQPEVVAEKPDDLGPDRPAPRARPARMGQEIDGALGDSTGVDEGRRFDEWTVSARSGERLTIDLKSEEFDPYLMIGRRRGSSGFSVLAQDDDGGEGLDARLRFRVPDDGEYVIRAAEVRGEAGGAYELKVSATAATAIRTNRAPVAAGRAATGAIEDSDPEAEDGRRYDEWTYAAKAGERLTIDLRSAAFDTYVVVGREENGAFTEIANDDDGGEGLNALLNWTAPGEGTYIIRASEVAGESGGEYTLTVTSRAAIPRRLNRARLAPGIDTRGTIEESDPENAEGQRFDEWTVTAKAGDRLTINMRSGDFDTFLFMGRGTGERFESLEQDDDGGEGTNAQLTFTVPADGEYTIRASELRGERGGAYTIVLTVRSGGSSGA